VLAFHNKVNYGISGLKFTKYVYDIGQLYAVLTHSRRSNILIRFKMPELQMNVDMAISPSLHLKLVAMATSLERTKCMHDLLSPSMGLPTLPENTEITWLIVDDH